MKKKMKDEKITFRISALEKRKLCKRAEHAGLSMSAYIWKTVVSNDGKIGKKDVALASLVSRHVKS